MKKKLIKIAIVLAVISVVGVFYYKYEQKQADKKANADLSKIKKGKTNDNGGKEIPVSQVRKQMPKSVISK